MIKRERTICLAIICLFVSEKAWLQPVYVSNTLLTEAQSDVLESPNWRIDFLSQPKYSLSTFTLGGKAIFVAQSEIEIYDFHNDKWITTDLTVPRRQIITATALNRGYLAGGSVGPVSHPEYKNRVDIYDAVTEKWTCAKLS